MGWANSIKIAAKSQVRVFGRDIIVSFDYEDDLKTKGIVSTKMETQKNSYCEVEGYSLLVSILQDNIHDVEAVKSITYQNKKYGVITYKIEDEAFYGFYLKE